MQNYLVERVADYGKKVSFRGKNEGSSIQIELYNTSCRIISSKRSQLEESQSSFKNRIKSMQKELNRTKLSNASNTRIIKLLRSFIAYTQGNEDYIFLQIILFWTNLDYLIVH